MLHPRDVMPARDWTLWGVFALLTALEGLTVGGYRSAWLWTAVAVVAVGIAVALRRSRPLIAFGAAAAVTCAELIQSVAGDHSFRVVHIGVLVLISFLVGRASDRMKGFVALVAAGNVALLVIGVAARGPVTLTDAVLSWFWIVIASLVFVILPWLYGRYREQHARLMSAGWERAERMESEQRMAIEQVRLRERNRIARDMHDSLGHELSLIALQAGALEVDGELPERHRRSAANLRTSAATATERLGELVGVLRADDSGAPVNPAVETVEQLVDRARASGMDIDLQVAGEPQDLAPLAEQAASRVAQEGLTNAAKHARGESVSVTAAWLTDVLELRVRNGMTVAKDIETIRSGGYGLTGLDERLRLIGGELAYEPSEDGFDLIARIPYDTDGATRETPTTERYSETASEHKIVRERARRGLRTAIAAPLAIGAVFGVVMLAYYLVLGYAAVLDETDYERIEVGEPREDIADLLPNVEMIDGPTESPEPDGTSCEYYRSSGPLSGTFAYQLCFEDDVLVSKKRVQTGSAPIDNEEQG